MNEGVIYLQLWVNFKFHTDVIISDILSIGGFLASHDLIHGERRNYL